MTNMHVCRKGFHALNIQCVCDANNRFLDSSIVAKWPDSTHDAHIWNNCSLSLSEAFETNRIGNGLLLGDSGYVLKPWLLTPKLTPTTAADRKYNSCHKSTRCVIERTYGIWKMRFRCLHRGLIFTPERNINIIVTTAVLHNICTERRIPLDEMEPAVDEEEQEIDTDDMPFNSEDGRRFQDYLIENVFTHLN